MKNFKTERDWADLDKPSKIVIAVAVAAWLMLSYGLTQNNNQIKNNVVKSEMVRSR